MRITVPEGKVALILSRENAQDLMSMCVLLRGPRRSLIRHLNDIYDLAGELIVAAVEGGGFKS